MSRPARALLARFAALVTAILLVATSLAATHDDAVAAGRKKRPRVVLSLSPAGETSRLDGAKRAQLVRYTTRAVDGRVRPATGLLLVPRGKRPPGGWPVVVYGHMTTGAADACAPTRGTPDHPEKQKMEQGDDLTRALLARGVMVLRPDYEGLGAPGPHPYLHGPSLGRAMVDMLAAVRRWRPRLVGDRWAVAGHSEGAVAALHVAARGRRLVPGTELVGVSAITPVTRMEVLVNLLLVEPLPAPPVGELVALGGLMLKGMAASEPGMEEMLLNGGLSPRARALWPDLETRCLAELSEADSWGGLAPADVPAPGAKGRQASRALTAWLAEHDVRNLDLRAGLPVRIDLGILDTVAPLLFTEELAQTYRGQGNPVTVGRWPSDHSPTNSAQQAAPAAADWLTGLLRD